MSGSRKSSRWPTVSCLALPGTTSWKRGTGAAKSARKPNSLSGHRLQAQREPALVSSRLVLVDDVFVGDAVDDAARCAQGLARCGLVAGLDGLGDALDRGAESRLPVLVVPAPSLVMPRRPCVTCA